jgi:DNA polymerase (family 10)
LEPAMDNRTIAERLTSFAHYLQTRRKNLYRVRAYRRAAETVLALDKPVQDIIADQGRKGLEILPGIGKYLSFTIANLIETGVVQTLSRPKAVKADRPPAVLLEAALQSTP